MKLVVVNVFQTSTRARFITVSCTLSYMATREITNNKYVNCHFVKIQHYFITLVIIIISVVVAVLVIIMVSFLSLTFFTLKLGSSYR